MEVGIRYSFNCLDYALTTYDNYYYNEHYLYNSYIYDKSDPISQIGYYSAGEDWLIDKFETAGFIKLDGYEPSCIIVYSPAHYAVSIEGVITSKLGTGDLVSHSNYDAYFSDIPVLYFARP